MPIDPVRACAALGGIASRAELLRAGASRSTMHRAVRANDLLRLRQGVYAVADLPDEVRAAAAHGGALTCAPRLRFAGLWLLAEQHGVHVAIPGRGRMFEHVGCVCVTHRADAPARGGMVPVVHALAHLRRCAGAEDFVVALESALRLGVLEEPGRAALRALVPKHAWALVDDARTDADSGLESLLRHRLNRLGISLQSQVSIPGVGRVDFVLGDRLILEVDGRDNHDGPSKRHRDLVRDSVAAAHGFDTLRFDYAMVVHDWPVVEAAILGKVERNLHLRRPYVG
ncbi:type IV toxin-antitoxin system AbiEi family antitoxin domain-containing protein [Agromyces marinus]|uniref:type IV toxin-antitoxin system AbiEi family antitoxin domain-containing protein n=1 Tax=Agromyces marinus TaxID=1389020 RepID=UPI001F2DCACE|nr:type IV toxin-antitoxin system AbiEi family antitoxin domain-containing protein [Agromyces marinus]